MKEKRRMEKVHASLLCIWDSWIDVWKIHIDTHGYFEGWTERYCSLFIAISDRAIIIDKRHSFISLGSRRRRDKWVKCSFAKTMKDAPGKQRIISPNQGEKIKMSMNQESNKEALLRMIFWWGVSEHTFELTLILFVLPTFRRWGLKYSWLFEFESLLVAWQWRVYFSRNISQQISEKSEVMISHLNITSSMWTTRRFWYISVQR